MVYNICYYSMSQRTFINYRVKNKYNMPIWAIIIIVVLVLMGARGTALKKSWPTDTSIPTFEISSTLEPTISSNPESISIPTVVPTKVIIPTATPTTIIIPTSQLPTPDTFKKSRLKQIEIRINEIDRTITNYQSNINYYLEQEKSQCNFASTPQYFQPESPPALPGETITPYPTRLLDPMIDIQSDYQCSMSFFSLIGELRTKINSLEREKREIELEKAKLVYQ